MDEEVKICLNCNGAGYHTCATCNGTGVFKKLYVPEYGKATEQDARCPWCEGTGKKRCGCCYGTGYITDEYKRKNDEFLRKIKKFLRGKAIYS